MPKHWESGHFRCRATIDDASIHVTITGGAETIGAPGEQFEYVRRLANAEEAQACLASLPKFGPDDASNHGFELTGRAIIN